MDTSKLLIIDLFSIFFLILNGRNELKQERSIELKTTSFQQNLEEVNNLDKYDHNLIPFTLIFNNNHQFIGCYDEERLIFEKERFHPGFSQIYLELS